MMTMMILLLLCCYVLYLEFSGGKNRCDECTDYYFYNSQEDKYEKKIRSYIDRPLSYSELIELCNFYYNKLSISSKDLMCIALVSLAKETTGLNLDPYLTLGYILQTDLGICYKRENDFLFTDSYLQEVIGIQE